MHLESRPPMRAWRTFRVHLYMRALAAPWSAMQMPIRQPGRTCVESTFPIYTIYSYTVQCMDGGYTSTHVLQSMAAKDQLMTGAANLGCLPSDTTGVKTHLDAWVEAAARHVVDVVPLRPDVAFDQAPIGWGRAGRPKRRQRRRRHPCGCRRRRRRLWRPRLFRITWVQAMQVRVT